MYLEYLPRVILHIGLALRARLFHLFETWFLSYSPGGATGAASATLPLPVMAAMI